MDNDCIKIGLAQISPVWLDKKKTISKIEDYISDAADQKCKLVVFGEALLPGYPFWLESTEGAKFNSPVQKELFAHYMSQAIKPYSEDLIPIRKLSRNKKIAIVLGSVERAADRGGHSLYCSLLYIDSYGEIQSVHRKLMPTYEERLVWSPGDGNGLRVHSLGPFTIGGLNCWENWMPLPRATLYGLGEDLHIAIWPGSKRNTVDITRFIAQESRSFVISVSGLMYKKDIPKELPHSDLMRNNCRDILADGGSCVAAPDGTWIIEPVQNKEVLLTAEISHQKVREERQNFDPSGHYSRPDVTKLHVNRKRQNILSVKG
jgi:nitrilase